EELPTGTNVFYSFITKLHEYFDLLLISILLYEKFQLRQNPLETGLMLPHSCLQVLEGLLGPYKPLIVRLWSHARNFCSLFLREVEHLAKIGVRNSQAIQKTIEPGSNVWPKSRPNELRPDCLCVQPIEKD